jgi:N-acetyl-anhydromuramyl-L-alanine amidase AmpD
MEIIKMLADKSNYGSARNTSQIKYIVIHYTGNQNDKAINNCKFFQSPNRNASAHYFIDDNSIYQSVDDNVVGWSVGGNKYPSCATSGGGLYYGKCTNNNSISVEMCNSVNSVPQKTKDNVKELVQSLMKKYNISSDCVIRHFDVVGKICPASLIDNTKWNEFKKYITSTQSVQTEVDDELFKAVQKIIKSGIELQFNDWKRIDLFVMKNVPALVCKLGGIKVIGAVNDAQYKQAIDKLVSITIITQRNIWDSKTYTTNHVRALLIKYANKLK